jgi:RNA polymerase sigma-70 factor (ECF subfamily)
VVRNAALDGGKLARRRQRRETAVARPLRWFVESEVEGLDAAMAVAALQRLPPDQREAIVARLWGGLSFEEIAAVAGCSASTAFRRYEAGIAALREELRVPCQSRCTP